MAASITLECLRHIYQRCLIDPDQRIAELAERVSIIHLAKSSHFADKLDFQFFGVFYPKNREY